jgi:hypothetical protein
MQCYGMLIQDNPLGFSKASFGGHSARSMMFLEMRALVQAMPLSVTKDDFTKAIIDENVLEKPTLSSRKKSLRHLVELYGLDTSKALFRVLWNFGHADFDSLPQLCLVCAYARDPQLRHSFELVRTLRLGEVLERAAMEQHLENGFPGRFSPAMKKSMAQNVNTTWTFGGHLAGRAKKTRRLPEPEHLADLLSEDLITGSTQLRQQLPGLLGAMEQDGVLMKVDSEYRLQTTEGAAWEAEFRKRRAAALNDQPLIASRLSQFLDKALTNTLGNPSVLHGDAKERRKVVLHHGEGKPEATDAITLWARDGFSAPESSVLADIRKLSTDDPTLHLFLPKSHTDEIKSTIASAQAAEETLHFKGNPTSQEGKECRQSMVTKQNAEGLRVEELIGQILGGARLLPLLPFTTKQNLMPG